MITDFQNKANYTWSTANNNTLPENANCTLKVYVREKDGKAKQATKTTTIKVTKPTYPDVNISSFSASKSGYVGDSVTLKASVSSGTAPYEYQYSYDDNKGTKHIITAYTANKTSTTWDTSSLSAGDYTIRVEVRDKNKKTATKTSTISLKTRNVKGSISTMETSYTQNDEWYPNVRFQVNISDFKTYSGSTQIELLSTSKDIGTYNYRLIVQDKNNKEYTAVVFYIYAQYLNGFITDISITKPDDILNTQMGFFSFIFVSIGAFILMIKTPRVLKNLVA